MRLDLRPSRAARGMTARLAASLLLGMIVMDLPDAWCDPLPIQESRMSASVPAPAGTDACGDVCVPDCFCCSASVPAVQPMRPPRPAVEAGERAALVASAASGFSPVPEHVPITGR